MTQKIQCQSRSFGTKTEAQTIRVKVIKAPLVDSGQLRQVIFARARAVVL
ncbi:MAG: hypothetical protein ABIE43_05265 [Patescibacteria group bacterium]